MENKQIYRGPSGIFLMFLVFMTLKLTDFIDWSWWWITAPLWVIPAFILSIVFIALVIGAIAIIIDKIKK